MSQNLIYGLVDPRTSVIRYVGQSVRGMDRPEEHQWKSVDPDDTCHKANWLRELFGAGFMYDTEPLEELPADATNEQIDDAERFWIAFFGRKDRGTGVLTNHNDGGGGQSDWTPSAETRAKWSVSVSSAWQSGKYEGRKSLKGVPRPPEVREKIRQAKTGVPRSPETCRKMSEALKGKPGRVQSEEERARRRLFRHSEESRARMSEVQDGREFSDESRQRMSEAQQRRRKRERAEREQSPPHVRINLLPQT